jgi:hypothetical protein
MNRMGPSDGYGRLAPRGHRDSRNTQAVTLQHTEAKYRKGNNNKNQSIYISPRVAFGGRGKFTKYQIHGGDQSLNRIIFLQRGDEALI